jgi:hypothetical protein
MEFPYGTRMNSGLQRLSGACERIYEYDNERQETARDTRGAYNFVFVQPVSPQPCLPN